MFIARAGLPNILTKSPEYLRPIEIRTYLIHLTQERRLLAGSIIVTVSALQFSYIFTLKRPRATLAVMRRVFSSFRTRTKSGPSGRRGQPEAPSDLNRVLCHWPADLQSRGLQVCGD